jgi:hypothetical protein
MPPLINLSIQHGQTLEEAQRHLETAVHEVHSRFGTLLRQVEWSDDRRRVRLDGRGVWVEMRVDAQAVHVAADIPVLGGLLGGPMATGLKQIVQRTFQKTPL